MPPLLELPSSLRTLAPSNNNWGSSAADALAAVKLTAEGDRTNRKVPLTCAYQKEILVFATDTIGLATYHAHRHDDLDGRRIQN